MQEIRSKLRSASLADIPQIFRRIRPAIISVILLVISQIQVLLEQWLLGLKEYLVRLKKGGASAAQQQTQNPSHRNPSQSLRSLQPSSGRFPLRRDDNGAFGEKGLTSEPRDGVYNGPQNHVNNSTGTRSGSYPQHGQNQSQNQSKSFTQYLLCRTKLQQPLNAIVSFLNACGAVHLLGPYLAASWIVSRPTRWLLKAVYWCVRVPMRIWYFLYITLPLMVLHKVYTDGSVAMKVLARKSATFRLLLEQVHQLMDIVCEIWRKIISSNLSELISFCITTVIEIFVATVEPKEPEEDVYFSDGASELIAYQDISDSAVVIQPHANKKLRSYFVPANLFRATVRLVPEATARADDVAGALIVSKRQTDMLEPDSPISIPPSPYGRSDYFSRSTATVCSNIIAARDNLRLQAQSVCNDEYSRSAAEEAQASGQYAVFDPKHKSDGIILNYANHCALKLGGSFCSSVRSMVPIRPGHYVYVECLVTVVSGSAVNLGIGLSRRDFPLNLMVGSRDHSLGVYADGQALVDGRSFRNLHEATIEVGSTIGMLVHHTCGDPDDGGDHDYDGRCDVHVDGDSGFVAARRVDEFGRLSGHSPTRGRRPSVPQTNASLALERSGSQSGSQSQSETHTPASAASVVVSETRSPRHSDALAAAATQALVAVSQKPCDFVSFAVNGSVLHFPADIRTPLQEMARSTELLYPTVSLFSEGACAWCHFCEADIYYRSRESIGAPPGVRVYCLDGSLLLRETD